MRRHFGRALVLVASCAISFAAWSEAGQVRVTVGGPGGLNAFIPADLSLSPGDHVVFVWNGGSHSATSGSPSGDCFTGDGLFDSGTVPTVAGRGTQFTWKSPNVTNPSVEYFCIPHCPEMAGILRIEPGNPSANFRITELRTEGSVDLIEITNMGNATGNLGRYRFVAGTDTSIVPAVDWPVPAGGRVTVHVNASGSQVVPSDLYLPTLAALADVGYVALYAPNTINGNLADATQMIDFVQTGAGGSAREATAVTAGLWTAGTFAPVVRAGHSLEFCGSVTDRGSGFWAEVSVPNFGTNGNCTTPAAPFSWGRVKVIYR